MGTGNKYPPGEERRGEDSEAAMREMTLKEYIQANLYPGHIAAKEYQVLKRREKQLEDLLCIIHRDGGQHIGEHGIEKSYLAAKVVAATAVQ